MNEILCFIVQPSWNIISSCQVVSIMSTNFMLGRYTWMLTLMKFLTHCQNVACFKRSSMMSIDGTLADQSNRCRCSVAHLGFHNTKVCRHLSKHSWARVDQVGAYCDTKEYLQYHFDHKMKEFGSSVWIRCDIPGALGVIITSLSDCIREK